MFRGSLYADTASIQEVVWLDDGRLAVGYTGYSTFAPKRGIIRTFHPVSTSFTYQDFISPPDSADSFSSFGTHLATSGEFLAANFHVTNDTWAVAIYEAVDSNWELRNILQPDMPTPNEDFGNDMAMSGRWIAIMDVGPAGGIYMFRRNDAGVWERKTLLHLPGIPVGMTFNNQPVALRGDLLAVGQYTDGFSNDPFTGRVHLWRLQPDDTWAFENTLSVTDGVAQDRFGFSLALTQNEIFVGAPQRDDGVTNSGALYIFTRTNNTWQPAGKIRLSNPKQDGNFGVCVDHSDNGPHLCIGDLTGLHEYKFLTNAWVHVGRNGGGNAFYHWKTSATTYKDYVYNSTNTRPLYPTQRGQQIIARFGGTVSLLEQATTTIITRPITDTCYEVPLGYVGLGPDGSPGSDLDNDRIGDFEEGYHGTLFDTNNVLPGGLTPLPAPGGFAIQWPHSIDPNLFVSAEPQWSSDLRTWTTNGISVQNLGMDPAGTEREILQATIPSTGSSSYFRLRFIVPDIISGE